MTAPAQKRPHRHAIGLHRREILQVGFSALVGLGTDFLLDRRAVAAGAAARAQRGPAAAKAPGSRAKSVILIFQTGAPSHVDTFDLKPDAPAEIRGDFKPIASRTPGLLISEHLPRLAALSDKFAVIRSMTHPVPSHEIGTHFLLTGIDALPPGSTHMASRNDWPCYASGLDHIRPRGDGVPSGVMLPTYLNNGYGFSGQHGGVLGPKHDPWQITRDPNNADFRVDELSLPPGLAVDRLHGRKSLLGEFDASRAALQSGSMSVGDPAFDGLRDRAFSLLTAGAVRKAFEIEREDPKLRDRYGRHMFGQSLLLARRLVEAGVPIVQANMGHMNQWDTHNANCPTLKNHLLPPLDRGVSALLEDLHARGLLEETLVVMVGEFGRTPKLGRDNGGNITNTTGRDHWSGAFSALFAGGGVRGGQVIGRTDKMGAYPATQGYYPSDLGATIYASLGIDPSTEIRDRLGRPLRLNRGQVIETLYQG